MWYNYSAHLKKGTIDTHITATVGSLYKISNQIHLQKPFMQQSRHFHAFTVWAVEF